jgi:hypothetical protein
MIDFGLVTLFALQCALVFLVYHAWRGIKLEISALEVHRRSNEAVTSGIAAIASKVDAFEKRIGEVEAAPKAGKARMEEIADGISKVDRRADVVEGKLASLSARVSANARWKKTVEEEEETAPASEEEGNQIPMGFMPPGAIPLSHQPPQGAVPPGFGVIGRKARHG